VCEEIKKNERARRQKKNNNNRKHTQLNNKQQELIRSTKEVREKKTKPTKVNRFGLPTQNSES
jgi:hypothetical protein